jgi:hypothetical protein
MFNTVRESVSRRIAYNRTLNALSELPLNSRLDLDIYVGDLQKIAHRAVYGN